MINYSDNLLSFDFVDTSHGGYNNLLDVGSFDPELTRSLQSLIDRRILVPSQGLTSARMDLLKAYDNFLKVPFYLPKWSFNIEYDPNLQHTDVKEWISQRHYNEDELNFFWLELYHNELSQYVQDQAKENLSLSLTDLEVLSISEYLSETYPLSKAFNLIYLSISSALRFQVQKQPKEKVLKTYLFHKILNMAEQKKYAQHIIKDFNRPAKVSISIKAEIIRKDIFKINFQ